MQNISLKNQIIDWLKGKNSWLQFAANIFLDGGKLDKNLLNTIYQFFKEDLGLVPTKSERKKIEFSISSDTSVRDNNELKLKTIKDISNVNALATEQSIPIHYNLTIIYGGNGTGKSGYIRLLNNAFNSRGDKHILPNVFEKNINGFPSCKFTFQTSERLYDLEYPKEKAKLEFTQFSVYDTHSAKVVLEKDNKLNFTPRGFEFFDNILFLYDTLKSLLSNEIQNNRPKNEFDTIFKNDNEIKNEIISLGNVTDLKKIEILSKFTEEDNHKLNNLITQRNELKSKNITQKILELKNYRLQLESFISNQKLTLTHFTPELVNKYKSIINSSLSFQKLIKEEGVIKLKDYKIANVASQEWRDFIDSARKYVSTIEKSKENYKYPTKGDRCIFCLQPISDDELKLINSYWNLFKSEAESQLSKVNNEMREIYKVIKNLPLVQFDETVAIYNYIAEKDLELAEKWKEIVLSTEKYKNNLKTDFKNKNLDLELYSFSDSLNDFDKIIKNLDVTIKDLYEKNTEDEIKKLDSEIEYLSDKNLLNKLFDKILLFISSHKWAEKAEKALSALNTKSITIKQGELFTQHITDKYTENFNLECENLRGPKFVNVIQKNVKISTLRKLQIAGLEANNILSEGEQRSISLADFITESQMNPNNRGLFFDDPVTSQDHERRELIANRLVELSTQKQIIIFTHDIAFLIRLKVIADLKSINYEITTMRNTGNCPGIINPELPWIAQNVKKRIGTLKDRLVKLKKIESQNNPDNYLFEAKNWYTLLREAWERAVEERLFKGVVERFLLGIQTQRLKNVVITEELISEVEKGMTDSSNWLHDAGAGLNPTPPDIQKAEKDIKLFEEFCSKCSPA